jgi:hypothetical protein
MQIGDLTMKPRNPIVGYSEGEIQREAYKQQYSNYAKKEL